MSKYLLFTIVPMLLLPWCTNAYNAGDYNPEHVPYNFDTAVDRQNCRDEMANFNADYNAIARGYNDSLVDVVLHSGIAWTLDNADNLFEMIELYYSTEFKDCIKDDDRRIRIEAEEAEFQKAIKECDFDYFTKVMTDKERMDTYDERMACKDELAAEAEEKEGSELIHIPEPEPVYVPPVVTPVVTEEPVVYEAPAVAAPINPTPVKQEVVVEDDTPGVVETEQAATSTSAPQEKVEMTQEELDQLIEQRVNEALEQSEPELVSEPEKPSFFKRVWNFLFGWL
jgi:hypothetical protein